MQLNFLHLTSASAIQRISFSSHHLHHHHLHHTHSKWKDRNRWPLEFIGAGGMKFSSVELKNLLVQSSCKLYASQSTNKSDTAAQSLQQEECSVQYELSSKRSPALHDQLPVMDLTVPRDGCQQQAADCQVELGPVCFHKGHQYFGGGG